MPTLTHVRLLVDEYGDCFRFYDDVVGLDATFGDAESGYADFDTGDLTLALNGRSEMADALGEAFRPGDGDRTAVVLRVDSVDDSYEAMAESDLATAVVEPTDHPEWGIRTAHVRDPDGTLVEVNEPLE